MTEINLCNNLIRLTNIYIYCKFILSLVITCVPAPADSTAVQTDTSAAKLTVVVMTATMSPCILISLIVCAILYFQKRRSNINSQSKFSYSRDINTVDLFFNSFHLTYVILQLFSFK